MDHISQLAAEFTYPLVHVHSSQYECVYHVCILKPHPKGCIGQVFLNLALHFNDIFFRHKAICSGTRPP